MRNIPNSLEAPVSSITMNDGRVLSIGGMVSFKDSDDTATIEGFVCSRRTGILCVVFDNPDFGEWAAQDTDIIPITIKSL